MSKLIFIIYPIIWMRPASRSGNGRCSQWPGRSNLRQIFSDIWREPERNRPTAVELSFRFVHVEFEVGDVDETGILMNVHHVGIQASQMQCIFTDACQ